ncbi:TRAP transporter permease [Jiella pacifica]|uniref:TRAP transporter fused permease subunit n=1 Tax=Jiella pacifica TaxID=2696469 RepID=A0A6N9SXY2_9HYPH|nr:TRAP transporter fused permease subunit [Jiella pacifica]NDW03162.1 TRAP transporter fused permease subunit [Jiella pacifica]
MTPMKQPAGPDQGAAAVTDAVTDYNALTTGHGGLWRLVTAALSLALLIYPLWAGLFGGPPTLVFLPTYLVIIMALTAFVLPARLFGDGKAVNWALNALIVAGCAAAVWVAVVWLDFALVFTLTPGQKTLCILLFLAVMEMTRRTSTRPLNYVAILAILYALFGYKLPNLFGHAGLSVDRLLWSQIFTTDGLFGTPLAIGATYIGLFVFFAAFLEASGGAQKFMNFTMAIAGRFQGGPAKIAILASALMGMMSGSSVTNIVTTGVVTIPMMKRVGYKREVAAGIEATASLGSQITPPILGATAFLMSEITGYPLIQIMALTIIPCLLFYFCIFMQVHLTSIRLNIAALDKSEIPPLGRSSLEVIPFLIPIVILVVLLWQRYSADYAVSVSILSFLVVCLVNPETRGNFIHNFMRGVRQGAATCIPLVGSLAMAGVIIGVLTMTGLGDRLSYLIEIVSGGNLDIMIVMTAVVCMLLGMGMVTVGAYVLVAVTVAPLMVDQGIELIVAHLFIFYFAVMSAISPPVMVGVFAAASIADSDVGKTAWHALRFSVVGFVVPFIFIYDPSILMLDGITFKGVYLLASTAAGIVALAIAFERFSFYRRIPIPMAAAFLVVAVVIMLPSTMMSTIGFVGLALLLGWEWMNHRNHRTAAQTSA